MSTLEREIVAMVKMSGKNMVNYIESCDDVKAAIIKNSIGAAASSLAAGWLPGIGALAATAVGTGFIWRMYYQINQALGIRVSKNILKSISSALLTNLVTGLSGVLVLDAAATALSLLPGVGSVSAAALLGAVNYGLVYVSGLVYIKMLTNLFHAKADIETMSEAEICAKAASTFAQNKREFQGAFDEAKKSAKKDIRNGNITEGESFDPGMECNA